MFAILLQFSISLDQDSSMEAAFSFIRDPLTMRIIGYAVIAVFIIAFVYILRAVYRKKRALPEKYHIHVLEILVPKDTLKQEKDKNINDSKQQIQEEISLAETLFSAIGGMKPQKGLSAWWWGRNDHLAFEIVAHNKEITFYAAAPKYLLKFVGQQIQAQFPHAHIQEVEDYNFFRPQGYVVGAAMTFKREIYFPINTYEEIDGDPLNALLAPLSQIDDQDGAAIQFVVRSAHKGWHKLGKDVASHMRQGKKLKEAKREAHGNKIGKFFGDFVSSIGKKDDASQQKTVYNLSPMEEEMIKRIETKTSKAGVDANIRVIVSAGTKDQAQTYLDTITGSFAQFNIYEYGNSFEKKQPRNQEKFVENYIFRSYNSKFRILLNNEEMASLYHFPLPQTENTKIKWLTAKRAPVPLNVPTEGLLLGYNKYRGKETPVYMKRKDRRRHSYIIGKSGSGKTVLIANIAKQDIANGEGLCVVDPHGDLVDELLASIPKERVEDVVLFDPSDLEYPIGMNLLEYDPNFPDQKTFVINEMLKIFDKLYDLKATGGPMFEQYVRNAMLLIMDHPESGSTLMEISKVLSDEDFRAFKKTKCKNQVVVDFWSKEAEKAGGEAALANMVPYITSKLNQFVANDMMRPIIGQQKSAFNIRELMDNKKILLFKLPKGKIGELNAYLLGMVIVGKILMAALSRTDQPEEERVDFYLYIDEFQNFTTDSIAIILSEARKYRLNLIIAHQFIGQLVKNNDTTIRDAVFGNVGTIISYKVGVDDAETLAKEYAPVFNEYDVINNEQFTAYIKLLVDNQTLRPFSLHPTAPVPGHTKEVTDAIAELSRLKYGRPREEVEAEIKDRAESVVEDDDDDDFNFEEEDDDDGDDDLQL